MSPIFAWDFRRITQLMFPRPPILPQSLISQLCAVKQTGNKKPANVSEHTHLCHSKTLPYVVYIITFFSLQRSEDEQCCRQWLCKAAAESSHRWRDIEEEKFSSGEEHFLGSFLKVGHWSLWWTMLFWGRLGDDAHPARIGNSRPRPSHFGEGCGSCAARTYAAKRAA